MRTLVGLAFLSGACALAYELLYLRALTSLFGDLFYLRAALLCSFLVGVGAGARLAHRWSRSLAAVEILVGVYALVFPFLKDVLAQQPWMATAVSRPAFSIAVTLLLMAPPSLLIGFGLPLFSSYHKALGKEEERSSFSSVYLYYNLGALSGAFLLEFWAVRYLGVSSTFHLLGGLNILIGVTLLVREAKPAVGTSTVTPPSGRTQLGVALTSLSSAFFQMFYLKLCFHLLEPHHQTFALGLVVILLGISLGTGLRERLGWSFAQCAVYAPLSLTLVYVFLPQLVALFGRLEKSQVSTATWWLTAAALALILGLPPMLFWGATVPAALRTESRVARDSGLLLWVSGLANGSGYLIYVLLLYDILPTEALLVLIVSLSVAAALLTGPPPRIWPLILIGTAILAVGWDDRTYYLGVTASTLPGGASVVTVKEGGESATFTTTGKRRFLRYNGHGSVMIEDERGHANLPERVSGVLAGLAAPSLERGLVLGLGSGSTAGSAARVFRQTDIVEISPAFVKAQPLLEKANLSLLSNSGATIHLADGRTFLVGKERLYDAVIHSIPKPTYFTASQVYTVEFYREVKRALKPGGVFSCWLQFVEMSEEAVHIQLASIREVFRHATLHQLSNGYYMLTCSDSPISLRSYSELDPDPLLTEGLQDSLSGRGLAGVPLDLYFESIRLSEEIFAHLGEPAVVLNTDDRPILEFILPRRRVWTEMSNDLFLQSPARYGLRTPGGPNPTVDHLVRSGWVLYHIAPSTFKQLYVDRMVRDPLFRRAWSERLEAHEGSP